MDTTTKGRHNQQKSVTRILQIGLLILLVGELALAFVLRVITLFVALYFASRIVTDRRMTLKAAFLGALTISIVYEICWVTFYFVNPAFSDWIALIFSSVVLLGLLLRYYDLGLFSSIALVMLFIGILFTIIAFRTAIIYLFFLPLPS
ncbi:MAG: hypothetical protein ACFE9D_10980 [Promethearchaeota archaeon]